MPNTDQYWQCDVALPDMEIFCDMGMVKDLGLGTPASQIGALGNIVSVIGAGTTGNPVLSVYNVLKRSGILASTALQQEQFGTAAGIPGPSGVQYTSDPKGIRGYPPTKANALATLIGTGGASSGPTPKGIQLNSFDVIYTVAGGTATTITMTAHITPFVDGAVVTPVLILPTGAYSLPTAISTGGKPYRRNIAIPSPAMISGYDTDLIIAPAFQAGAGCTITVHGFVLKCSYNFN